MVDFGQVRSWCHDDFERWHDLMFVACEADEHTRRYIRDHFPDRDIFDWCLGCYRAPKLPQLCTRPFARELVSYLALCALRGYRWNYLRSLIDAADCYQHVVVWPTTVTICEGSYALVTLPFNPRSINLPTTRTFGRWLYGAGNDACVLPYLEARA